jgi:hypothetical protein
VHFEEAARLWQSRGWPSLQASVLMELGLAIWPVDRAAARVHWGQARDVYARLDNPGMVRELSALLDAGPDTEPDEDRPSADGSRP